MIVFILTLFSSEEAANDMLQEPDVFAGVSGMDCVNQVKQHMVDNYDLGLNGEEDESRAAFNAAGTVAELKDWFAQHYCSLDIKENCINLNQLGSSPAVVMPHR